MKINTECPISVDSELTLIVLFMDDAYSYFELINSNREHLKPWLGWVDNIQTVEDAKVDLRKRLVSFYQGNRVCYGIYSYGLLVGRITLSNQKNEVNIGYFVGKNSQGKGIVTRSLSHLVKYSFDNFDIHRFKLMCQINNTGSNAIAKRLNFEFEGIAKSKEFINGEYVDLNCYALIR